MVSLRTIVPLVGFTLAFLQGAVAAPVVAAVDARKTCTDSPPTPTSVSHAVTTPSLPVNGGPTELPAPAATLKLLHVAVGKGVQNYTCTSGATPVSDGALATLYDVTDLAFTNINTVHALPPVCVMIPPADVPKGPIYIPGSGSFPVLGEHFFTNTSPIVPTFALSEFNQLFSGSKILGIAAPATASKGPAGTGAVPWLDLGNSGLSTGGVTAAYRVVTAGGSAPVTCTTTGIISVQYCAEYWFYG